MASGGFIKKLRIIFLIFVLIIVAGDYWFTKLRTTDWDMPLHMVVYPINGDNSERAAEYIEQLTEDVYQPVEEYFIEEAAEYELPLKDPVIIKLGPVVDELPPRPPADRQVLKVMWWSLKMRYWAFSVDAYKGPAADVRMFLVYYDPNEHQQLKHSLGLEKGLIAVVNAFADVKKESKNNIVLAHEFLHTVGATDKYDLASGAPLFPVGYVEPDRDPLYPQEFAEIMAGVTPISEGEWIMPEKLSGTLIGLETAKEINWIPKQ